MVKSDHNISDVDDQDQDRKEGNHKQEVCNMFGAALQLRILSTQ